MKVSAAGVANNPVVFTQEEIAGIYRLAMYNDREEKMREESTYPGYFDYKKIMEEALNENK